MTIAHLEPYGLVSSRRASAKRTAERDNAMIRIEGETVITRDAIARSGVERDVFLRRWADGLRTWAALSKPVAHKVWRLYRIEGEELTIEQIRERLPLESLPMLQHRLGRGVHTWDALKCGSQPGRRLA